MTFPPDSPLKTPIKGHGACPDEFLSTIMASMLALPDAVFAPKPSIPPDTSHDVYSLIVPVLGPWSSVQHRRAAMCEVLRVVPAFESDFNWNEGADTTAGAETPEETETGAFQVSANSMAFDPSLAQCVLSAMGGVTPQLFIAGMKENHTLACQYVARLFRFNTRWSGPSNRGWTTKAVRRDAVNQFQSLLAVQPT